MIEECIISNHGYYLGRPSNSRGVIIIRPRYVAFLPANDELDSSVNCKSSADHIAVFLALGTFSSSIESRSADAQSVMEQIKLLQDQSPTEFDESVARLVSQIGGVLWRPSQTEVAFKRANQVEFVGSQAKIRTVNPLSESEFKQAKEFVVHWPDEFLAAMTPLSSKTPEAIVRSDTWLQHTCVACGSRFRYPVEIVREVGTAANGDAATQPATANRRYIKNHPCPHCGFFQPEMFVERRTKYFDAFAGATMFLLMVPAVLNLIQYVAGPNAFGTALSNQLTLWLPILNWGTVAISTLFLFIQFRIISWTPNRDPMANQMAAMRNIDRGQLVLIDKPTYTIGQQHEFSGSRVSGTQYWVLFFMMVSLIGMCAGELARLANNWPLNPGCLPPVVGSKDRVVLYFPESIESIESQWRGQATVTVLNASELGLKDNSLPAWTAQKKWGENITAEVKNSRSLAFVWVEFDMPEGSGLAGKKIDLRIEAVVDYPKLVDKQNFIEVRQEFQHTTQLSIASPLAGRIFSITWWVGYVIGFVVFLLGTLRLRHHALQGAQQGHPIEILKEEH